MSRDNSLNGSSLTNDTDTNKSFVRKVKSRVSGLFSTSLTKWFGSTEGPKIRPRDDLDEEDDESFQLQPPTKRSKPSTANHEPAKSRSDLEMNFITTPLQVDRTHAGASFNIGAGLFPETSTTSPGPSTIKSRKLILPNSSYKNNFNGDIHNGDKDSDSGESTSGYSSMPRIGSKEHVSEDKNSTPNRKPSNSRTLFNSPAVAERSIFNERGASPNLNSSLSSRRPSFNTSTFGSSNFMDRTLSTKRIVNSPFYVGRTTYGGASAYSRNLMKRSPELSNIKNYVQPKPVSENASKNVTLSKTAKRILDTLEQYTSPAEDIRKIPNPKRLNKPEGLISKYTGANPYLVRDLKVPSNSELQVPRVTDMLKMKERLQDSTQSVRELAKNSNSALNVQEYNLPVVEQYPTKSTNKMKTKVASIRKKAEPVEILQDIKLPDVQLPISTLPSFDFTIPLPPKEIKKTPTKPVEVKAIESPKIVPEVPKPVEIKPFVSPPVSTTEYRFSKPVVISENKKDIKAINNFKFSDPVCKKSKSENFKSSVMSSAPVLKKTSPKKNGENGPIAAAKELLTTGSVMDVLGKNNNVIPKFKSDESSWECSLCMIRNLPDKKKCVTCNTPRSTPEPKPAQSFGDKFKLNTNQWECSVCLIRNDATKTKCVACENPKIQNNATTAPKISESKGFGNLFKMPANKWECSACMVRNDTDKTKCVACETPKPAINSGLILDKWECTVCMVRNEKDKLSCVACTTPKPCQNSTTAIPPITNNISSFGDKFKPAVGSWECGTCLIKNEPEKVKCVACETPKPGAITSIVKKNESQWECSSCMVRNSSEKLKCVCCESAKPGTNPSIPASIANNEPLPKFNFGIDKAQLGAQGFSFGIKPEQKKSEDIKGGVAPSSIFGDNKVATSEVAAVPTFSFGAKPANGQAKPVESEKGFSFGAKSTKRPASDDSNNTAKISAPTPAVNGDVKKDSKEPTFGVSASPAAPAANLFNFGKANTTTTPSFGDKPATTVSFGDKPSSTLSFGDKLSSTPAPVVGSKTQATPTFKFGAPSTTAPQTNGPTQTPVFGATKPTQKETLFSKAATTTQEPIFKFGKTDSTPAKSMFSAGSNNVSAGGFSFSSKADPPKYSTNPPSFPTSTPTFGTPSTNASPFAATTPAPAPAPAFGSTTTTQASSNSFIFGSSPATNNTSSVFGAAPAAAPTPVFGSPSAGNAFGGTNTSAAPPPTFGTPAQNGIFNFGASPACTTPKTGFNFGSSPAAAPAAGPFAFGANTSTLSKGGFNFNASGATPTFNADVKPAFNFTAGSAPNTFSAQQSGPSTNKQRVVRRALRRTQR